MNYRLGLDIGIASVGWAVVRTDSKDEPCGIERMGVRIFDAAEVPKTGDSLAAARRAARSTRRRLRRRHHRIERTKWLLEQNGFISQAELEERYQSGKMADVYEVRVRALNYRISDEELAQVLIYLVKHRGFRSTRKSETLEQEGGKVLAAVHENEKLMEEKGYRTVGEMIYLDESFRKDVPWSETHYLLTPRNKAGDYRHTILRSQLRQEAEWILDAQQAFGNEKITDDFIEAYLSIFDGQRSFDEGPGVQSDHVTPSPYAGSLIKNMVGKCTFEPTEKRAPKASYTAQRFMLLQKVNHTRIVCKGEVRNLSDAERESIIAYAYEKKDISYSDIRKRIRLEESELFKELNYQPSKKGKSKEISSQKRREETEKKTRFISLKDYHDMKKQAPEWIESMEELQDYASIDEAARILSCYKGDDARIDHLRMLQTKAGFLPMEVCEKLLSLSPTKFGNLSLTAMNRIMPYLEQGLIYNEACEAAGYDFNHEKTEGKSKFLSPEAVKEMLEDIPNPVVCRSITQTAKVVNAIIREYGSPIAVHIELAREMAKNHDQRADMKKAMTDNESKNEKVKKQLQEYGCINPTGLDIVKYKLWMEQDGKCMYSGETISIGDLFQKGFAEVDHVIPYSQSFDDSYRNKVLVKSKYNQEKGNRTPFEYFGSNESWWKEYEKRVVSSVKDLKKQQNLLKQHLTDEERKEFKTRNLQDTKYITSAVSNLIRQNLELAPYESPDKKRHVFTVNGAVTDYLKKRWGLPKKDRRTDKHHAMDALVVACTTQGMIQKISKSVQAREMKNARDCVLYDEDTGEIYERRQYSREEWDELFGVRIPAPWNLFQLETAAFLAEDPSLTDDTENEAEKRNGDYFSQSKSLLVQELCRRGYRKNEDQQEIVIPSIFVSRMPKHKVTGAGHEETIKSAKQFDDRGIVISKTALSDLKLGKDGEIENYYEKESDLLLYHALKERLEEYGGDAKKAFPVRTEFHKPKSDGTDGPVVRKVKTYEKQTLGVKVNGGKGICSNGSMVRVDVFRENGKYYLVPIYTKDIVKKELPNKAAVGGKPYRQWKEMKEENFLFSLYQGDLIEVKQKEGKTIALKGTNKEKIGKKKIFAYFTGMNISTVSISGELHDKSFSFEGLGVQSLGFLKKYQVNILGDYYEVKSEQRMTFEKRKAFKLSQKATK